MSLTTALEAALDKALRDADAVADDVLLSRNLKTVAETIVQRHGVEPVRLHRVVIDSPHPTKMAVAGDPGHEDARRLSASSFAGRRSSCSWPWTARRRWRYAIGDDEDLAPRRRHGGRREEPDRRALRRRAPAGERGQPALRRVAALHRGAGRAVNGRSPSSTRRLEPAILDGARAVQGPRGGAQEVRRRAQAAGLLRALVGPAVELAETVLDDRGAGPLPSGPAPRRVWWRAARGSGPAPPARHVRS